MPKKSKSRSRRVGVSWFSKQMQGVTDNRHHGAAVRPQRAQAARASALTRAMLTQEAADEDNDAFFIQMALDAAALRSGEHELDDGDDFDEAGTGAGVGDDGNARARKRSRVTAVFKKTCSACMDDITDDGYTSTCTRSASAVLCHACLPSAVSAAAAADGATFTEKGLCLSHMSATCSKFSAKALLAAVTPHVGPDVVRLLLLKLHETRYMAQAIEKPLSLLAACQDCGTCATVAPPELPAHSIPPFVVCTRCKGDAICLACRHSVCGSARPVPRAPRAAPGFTFVEVDFGFVYDDAEGRYELVDGEQHLHCCYFMSFQDVVKAVRVRPVIFRNAVPPRVDAPAVPVPFPSPDVERFFKWAAGCVVLPTGMEVTCDMATVDELPLLTLLRQSFAHLVRDVVIRKARHVLDVLFDRAMTQRCPKCGKCGVKDANCTHIGCCAQTWCYVCEKRAAASHACPLSLERGDMLPTEEGVLLAAADAVAWFHVAKLATYARAWLCHVGVARGLFTLLTHPAWRVFVAEHASKMFITDAEQLWFMTVRLNADVRRECYF